MRRILSFVTIFLASLLHSFPVEPDDQLGLFNLDPDPMAESANTNLDLTYQPIEADNMFSSVGSVEFPFNDLNDLNDLTDLNDLNDPIVLTDEASSAVSHCVGESMEPFHVARSLELLQPFDIAAEQNGFCLKDGEQKSPPIKLNLPTSLDELNTLLNAKPLEGRWVCPGTRTEILVCCKPASYRYITRAGCKKCRFEKCLSSILDSGSRYTDHQQLNCGTQIVKLPTKSHVV